MSIKPVLSRKQNIALCALVWCEVVASAHGKRLGDFSADMLKLPETSKRQII